MIRRPTVHLVAAVTLLVGVPTVVGLEGAQEASAYATLGCRFFSASISYHNGGDTTYGPVISNAISDWGNATSHISFSGVSSGGFGLFATGWGNSGWDGYTFVSTCTSGVWAQNPTSFANRYYTDSYGYSGQKSIFSHEIGHALGLAHVPSTSAIMQPSSARYTLYGLVSPQSDDINGVNSIY